MFSVNVLIYGNFPKLAERCLSGIVQSRPWSLVRELNIGLNVPSPVTRDTVQRWTIEASKSIPVRWFHETTLQNVWKYPLMRAMLRATEQSWFVWFDDDSYLTDPRPDWWRKLADAANPKQAAVSEPVLLGPRYFPKRWTEHQEKKIREQPWFRGKPLKPLAPFAQGGFWATSASFLRACSYPFPELVHNGGDTILGEMCRQLDVPFVDFRDDVLANAGDSGRESGAKRRGGETPRLWQDPAHDSVSPELSHYSFDYRVTTWRNRTIAATATFPASSLLTCST